MFDDQQTRERAAYFSAGIKKLMERNFICALVVAPVYGLLAEVLHVDRYVCVSLTCITLAGLNAAYAAWDGAMAREFVKKHYVPVDRF